MPREFGRNERVADYLKRELALLIQNEVKDPRLGMVNINDVEVGRDLSRAKVFFTLIGDENEAAGKQAAEVLNKAAGFLRNQVAANNSMRSTPALQFYYDQSVLRGDQLSKLIDQAVADDQQPNDEQ